MMKFLLLAPISYCCLLQLHAIRKKYSDFTTKNSDHSAGHMVNNTMQDIDQAESTAIFAHGTWVRVKYNQYNKPCYSVNGVKQLDPDAPAGCMSAPVLKKKVSAGALGVVVRFRQLMRPKRYSEPRTAVSFNGCLLWIKSASLTEAHEEVAWDLTQPLVHEYDMNPILQSIWAGCGEEKAVKRCGCPELLNVPGVFLEEPLWKIMCKRKLQTVQVALNDNGYMMLRLLGQGGFGSVFEVMCVPSKCNELGVDSGSKFAAKISKSLTPLWESKTRLGFEIYEDVLEKGINKEYDIMEHLQNPTFAWKGKSVALQAYDRFETRYLLTSMRQTVTIVVMEKLKSELGVWVKDTMQAGESTTDNLMKDLAGLVSLLHKAGYVHDDIKNDNIGIANDDRRVLLDFGGSRKLEDVQPAAAAAATAKDWSTLSGMVGGLDRSYGKFIDVQKFVAEYFNDDFADSLSVPVQTLQWQL